MTERVESLPGSDGRPVRLTHRDVDSPRCHVVVAHGFKGFREWGFFPGLCEELSTHGHSSSRLDFSHNGVEETDFDRLDLFLLDTWTRHQEDLAAVVGSLSSEVPLVLLGHSRGGADVLLHAAQESRVRAVITLAAVADPQRVPADTEQQLRELGYYPIPNARTGQVMPVSRAQLDDANNHNVLRACAGISPRPLLVIHGTADETVPMDDAEAIAKAHGGCEPVWVEGAGHTFGMAHPPSEVTDHFRKVIHHITRFLDGLGGEV